MSARGLIIVVAAALLSACATVSPPPPLLASCPPTLSPATEIQVYFGRNIPTGGEVSDADWATFLNDEVTSRFPFGFTVLDGAGQYQGGDGVIVREASKVLVILTPDPAGSRVLIKEIGDAYLARFDQEGVLVVEGAACAGDSIGPLFR